MKRIEGRILFLDDNIDTDVIIPGQYLRTLNFNELAQHVFEGISPEASRFARTCSIVVAGENFGCGSSREQAALAIKFSGIQCVLARSFARIFYRNALNIGLLVMEFTDELEIEDMYDTDGIVDPDKHTLTIGQQVVELKPLPDFAMEMVLSGGVINWYKEQAKRSKEPPLRILPSPKLDKKEEAGPVEKPRGRKKGARARRKAGK